MVALFGMKLTDRSILKPWRVVTDHHLLVSNLSKYRCKHPPEHKHEIIQGSLTPKTTFYPIAMCEVIVNSLYPNVTTSHVPSMICSRVASSETHREGLLKLV